MTSAYQVTRAGRGKGQGQARKVARDRGSGRHEDKLSVGRGVAGRPGPGLWQVGQAVSAWRE